MHAAGHEVVPGPFGRGLAQDWGLELHEFVVLKEFRIRWVTRSRRSSAASSLGAAEVEEAVFHARSSSVSIRPRLERRGLRRVSTQHRETDLDIAGGHVGVLGTSGTATDGATKQHDPLGPNRLGDGKRLARSIGIEGALDNAGAVPDVEEDQATVVAPLGYPARDPDLFTDGVGSYSAARVRAHR